MSKPDAVRAALLPCPFCGNDEGIDVANTDPESLTGGYFIACPKCDASTGLRFACGDDPRPLLVEQWNRRAALAEQPAEPTLSQKLAAAGFTRRPSLRAMEMREALELIAAPMRPDGTWNRDREACRLLAAEALGRYDDDGGAAKAPHPAPSVAVPGGRIHELKTWTSYYAAVESGKKTFEVRLNDRDFRVGDVLRLREWSVESGDYTGRECWRTVTYVLTASEFCKEGFAILGIAASPQPPTPQEVSSHPEFPDN